MLLPQPKHRDLFGVRETLLRPEDKAANNNEKLKKENESLKEKNRLLELKVTLLINERVTRSKTNLENMSNNENTNAPSIAPSIDSINHQKYMSKANVIDPSVNINDIPSVSPEDYFIMDNQEYDDEANNIPFDDDYIEPTAHNECTSGYSSDHTSMLQPSINMEKLDISVSNSNEINTDTMIDTLTNGVSNTIPIADSTPIDSRISNTNQANTKASTAHNSEELIKPNELSSDQSSSIPNITKSIKEDTNDNQPGINIANNKKNNSIPLTIK